MKESDVDAKNIRYLELLRTSAENQPDNFLSFLDIVPVGICITDETGKFVQVNQAYCELYQYDQSELIGNSFTMVVPDEWKAYMQELHDLFMNKKYELQGKWDVIDKYGNVKKIISNAAYLSADRFAGPCKMTFVVEVDKTQQVLNELNVTVELLQKKIGAQDVAQQLVSHDVRNNLTSILQISEILLGGHLTEKQEAWLTHLRQSGSDALDLMQAITDYAKMEQGQYKLAVSKFNIVAIIREELQNLSKITENKGVNVSLSYQDRKVNQEEIMIQGDRFYIQRMLHNLLLNAVEASSNQQSVSITLQQGKFFTIIIHNEGTIPQELREMFFEKFATAGKQQGTGLGTYIAKLIVEMHHGSIAYHSSEEKGTDIVILLPQQVLSSENIASVSSKNNEPNALI